MLMQTNAIVIVDAYSTGKYLAPIFKGYGYQCIHVQSKKHLNAYFSMSFEKNNFIRNIIFENDLSAILKELTFYKIIMVIPGCESGVELADTISNGLNLPTSNSAKLSIARRDKYLMHETLKKNKVAAIDQLLSSSKEDIIDWVYKGSGFPIVIKPTRSAGTDNVSFCYNKQNVYSAFDKIIGKEDFLGHFNNEILVQKMVEGQEYIVNSVSHNGIHFITDIWTSNKTKINNSPIYDYQELLDKDDAKFDVLSEYVKSVLNALEIRFGAGHSEVMMTKDGPVLIEIGARLAGGIDPSVTSEALGYSHVSILVDSYLNPDNFLRFASQKRLPSKKRALKVFLISHKSGIVRQTFDYKFLANIKDLHSISVSLKIGDKLETTSNLFNSPGLVCIVSPDKKVLENGYRKIREIENQIYENIL